jgi:hypothetical protein
MFARVLFWIDTLMLHSSFVCAAAKRRGCTWSFAFAVITSENWQQAHAITWQKMHKKVSHHTMPTILEDLLLVVDWMVLVRIHLEPLGQEIIILVHHRRKLREDTYRKEEA